MIGVRQIFKQSSIYGSADIVTKAIAFLLIPVFTHFLDVPDYGRLALFQSFAGVLSIVFLWGSNASLASFYHFKEYRDRFEQVKENTVRFLLGFNLLAGCGLLWLAHFAGVNFSLTALVIAIAYLAVARTAESVHYVHSNRPKHQFLLVTGFSIASAMAVVTALLFFPGYDPVNRIFTALAATGTVFFLVLVARNRFYWTTSFDSRLLKSVLVFGVPVLPHALSQWILNFADRAMLRHFLDYREVGIYSLGYNFGMVMLIFLAAINTSWGPAFLNIAENEENAPEILSAMGRKIWIAFCLAASGCLLWIHEMVTLSTPVTYHGAVILSKWIIISYLVYGSYLLYANGLFAARKSKMVPLATVTAALVNILLNWMLIPRYGSIGAVAATAVSFMVMAILVYLLAKRFYPIGIGPGFLLLTVSIPVAIFPVSIVVDGFENMIMRVILKSVLTAPLCFYAYGKIRSR